VTSQHIRFCTAFDGARVAYAVTGGGTPFVRAPHWLTHLEYEYESPIWRPWITALSARHRLLRMDLRGCGLSDRDIRDFSFDAYVRDLEAVVDAAGFTAPFALFGHSQSAAIAIAYAAAHPQRVSQLVVLGGYARGVMKRGLSPERLAEYQALVKLIEAGWGSDDASYRKLFAMQFIPGGTLQEINSLGELQRASCSAASAVRIVNSYYNIDAREAAARVRCPTLVMHARGDHRVPFEEGRLIAGIIPDARFVALDTDNHVPLAHEPAFNRFFTELRDFLPAAPGVAAQQAFAALTPREAQILERIARGYDNTRIAGDLGVSEKTVRNNVTRIFDKLGVATRAEAIVRARDSGLGKE
jgi:pimeloyl-ACP methyl ester carboxylesterase/DNA-binding CsgD family transcriptional regulator